MRDVQKVGEVSERKKESKGRGRHWERKRKREAFPSRTPRRAGGNRVTIHTSWTLTPLSNTHTQPQEHIPHNDVLPRAPSPPPKSFCRPRLHRLPRAPTTPTSPHAPRARRIACEPHRPPPRALPCRAASSASCLHIPLRPSHPHGPRHSHGALFLVCLSSRIPRHHVLPALHRRRPGSG